MYIIQKWEKTVIGLEMPPAITSMSYSPVVEKCTTNLFQYINNHHKCGKIKYMMIVKAKHYVRPGEWLPN